MKREKIINYLINNAGTESHLSEKIQLNPISQKKLIQYWLKSEISKKIKYYKQIQYTISIIQDQDRLSSIKDF